MKTLKFKQLEIGGIYLIADKRDRNGTGYEQTPVMRVWNNPSKSDSVTLVSLLDGATWTREPDFKYAKIDPAICCFKIGKKKIHFTIGKTR